MLDYFYTEPENIKTEYLIIDGEEFNHLTHVMRKKKSDIIMVVDGLCNAYEVEITNIERKTAKGRIISKYPNHNEGLLKITMAVGILKNPAKYDFMVEKVTELGVCEIIPLCTERTIPKHAKTDRWQKLALSAMKQSGRSFLPQVNELTNLDEILKLSHRFDLKLLLHNAPQSTIDLKQLIDAQMLGSVIILVGPEGGFSETEIRKIVSAEFKILTLGNRRLRTETAVIAAASLLLARQE